MFLCADIGAEVDSTAYYYQFTFGTYHVSLLLVNLFKPVLRRSMFAN